MEEVILALMTPRLDYLAQMLRKAISGIGTKESLLVDILCTASNGEIRAVVAAYQRRMLLLINITEYINISPGFTYWFEFFVPNSFWRSSRT